MITVGMRLNNPCNIMRNQSVKWIGETESSHPRLTAFESLYYGIRAGLRIIDTYVTKHGLNTVRKIITRYAPPVENPTNNYVDYVAKQLNADPDEVLDMAQIDVRGKLLLAVINFEQGPKNHAITLDHIKEVIVSE